jgi:hypothetical protein
MRIRQLFPKKRKKQESRNFPIWDKVKDRPFPEADGTFQEVIGSVDSYLTLSGVECPSVVLEHGHRAFFPGTKKEHIENVICDADTAVKMLRKLIYLSPDNEAVSGTWLTSEVSKRDFGMLWEFTVFPAVKRVQKLYGVI